MKHQGRKIKGSPFKVKVFDLEKIRILRDERAVMLDEDVDGIPGSDVVFYGLVSMN